MARTVLIIASIVSASALVIGAAHAKAFLPEDAIQEKHDKHEQKLKAAEKPRFQIAGFFFFDAKKPKRDASQSTKYYNAEACEDAKKSDAIDQPKEKTPSGPEPIYFGF